MGFSLRELVPSATAVDLPGAKASPPGCAKASRTEGSPGMNVALPGDALPGNKPGVNVVLPGDMMFPPNGLGVALPGDALPGNEAPAAERRRGGTPVALPGGGVYAPDTEIAPLGDALPTLEVYPAWRNCGGTYAAGSREN